MIGPLCEIVQWLRRMCFWLSDCCNWTSNDGFWRKVFVRSPKCIDFSSKHGLSAPRARERRDREEMTSLYVRVHKWLTQIANILCDSATYYWLAQITVNNFKSCFIMSWMKWKGMKWNETDWNGMKRNETEWNRMKWNETKWNRNIKKTKKNVFSMSQGFEVF